VIRVAWALYAESRVFSCGEKKLATLPGVVVYALRHDFALGVIALDIQVHKMNEVLRSRDNEV
jgi:hypothetical protein